MNKQDCPNFGELLENRALRKELEQERKRREDAERESLGAYILSIVFLITPVIAVALHVTYGGMSGEDAGAYAKLVVAFALLFLSLSVFLLTMVSVCKYFKARKNNKKRGVSVCQR